MKSNPRVAAIGKLLDMLEQFGIKSAIDDVMEQAYGVKYGASYASQYLHEYVARLDGRNSYEHRL